MFHRDCFFAVSEPFKAKPSPELLGRWTFLLSFVDSSSPGSLRSTVGRHARFQRLSFSRRECAFGFDIYFRISVPSWRLTARRRWESRLLPTPNSNSAIQDGCQCKCANQSLTRGLSIATARLSNHEQINENTRSVLSQLLECGTNQLSCPSLVALHALIMA
jgi:hypothetical protein